MNFDKKNVQIAVGIPYFRMRHTADWPVRMNEINISTIAIDETGLKNAAPSMQINSHSLVNPVQSWERVDFAGSGGRLVYGPANPGSFLFCACIYIERDDRSRDIGKQLAEIVKNDELKSITKALSLIPNPTVQIVNSLLAPVTSIVARLLKNNKDDILFTHQGTFFRDIKPPYSAGDTFITSNKYIESALKVIPLYSSKNKQAEEDKGAVAFQSPFAEQGMISLDHSKLAGEPTIVKFS